MLPARAYRHTLALRDEVLNSPPGWSICGRLDRMSGELDWWVRIAFTGLDQWVRNPTGFAYLKALREVAERTGLEPATPGVTGRYSNQLNYRSR